MLEKRKQVGLLNERREFRGNIAQFRYQEALTLDFIKLHAKIKTLLDSMGIDPTDEGTIKKVFGDAFQSPLVARKWD